MATMEVHDNQGRVQFIELARDHPVLFGTSAACDIVLAGEGVLPVHGRIRWKKRRYRVEASPDAEFVVINGMKMTSSSLHQGDEMTVGPCRLFLLRMDDDEQKPGRRSARHPDEERTKVLQGPMPYTPPPGETHDPVDHGARDSRKASPRQARRESPLEREDWLKDLAAPADLETTSQTANGLPPATANDRFDGRSSRSLRQAPKRAHSALAQLRWLNPFRSDETVAPGKERILSSPLVMGLILAFGLLILLGVGLRAIIAKTLADQLYSRGVGLMEDGDYRTAMRDLDNFVAAHPKDPRVGKARVLRALANVRQYVSVSGGTWSTALDAATEMVDTVGAQPEFRDEQVELAELVIRIGEGLADRARRSVDDKALQDAEEAVRLHARIAGEPAPTLLKRSRLPGLLDEARAAIHKAHVRGDALAAMDAALQKGSASGVYQARDALVERYADLAQDRDLVGRMTKANDLIRRAVKLDSARKAAVQAPRAEPLGPPISLVLRSRMESPKGPPAAETIVFAIADGFVTAIDAATGAPLWQKFVGLAAPFLPQPIAGDPSALVVDARSDELLRLDARTGGLIWRLELGEPVECPPLVLGEQLYQVLPSGKLIVIALKSGERQASLSLGIPLSRAPVSDEQGRFLYVVGRRDCLFVVARDTLSCVAVEYLGHEEGSIPCEPVRLGRFLIVVENDRPADGRWRVLLLDEEGAKVRPVQQVDVAGWTWSPPASSGSVIWATGDRGGIEAFALGDYASKTPLRSLARLSPETGTSGPAFGMATSERELWLGAGRSGRYELDPDRGTIAVRSPLEKTGPAVAPVQLAGRRVVLTFQDPGNGGTSLLGLDPTSGSIAWQTILGAPWPTPLIRVPRSAGLRSVGQTGKNVIVTPAELDAGGFAVLPLPRPGEPRIPSGEVLTLEGDGPEVSILASPQDPSAVWVQDPAQPGGWRRLELPAAMAATPLVWARSLLVPGVDGRAYLIDPVTAASTAEPLVPVFDRDRRGRWKKPIRIGASTVVPADDAGRVRRVALKTMPVPRLVIEAESLLDKGIVADPACTGDVVYVVTADQRVRSLSTRDLSPLGAWPLAAPLAAAPVTVAQRAFVFDTAGEAMMFGNDGRRVWSIKLDAPATGAPVIEGDSVWLLDRDGSLDGRALVDGVARQRISLGIVPAGGLRVVEGRTIVASGRGVLQRLIDKTKTNPRP